MNTFCSLERFLMLVMRPIVPLSTAVLVASLVAPGNAYLADATTLTTSLSPTVPSTAVVVLVQSAVEDYQPPNNGGPGKTGGSGTRWH